MKTIIKTLSAIILITCIITLLSGKNTMAQNTEYTRYGAVGFSIGNKGYIGTGMVYLNGSYSTRKDFWEYDPIADSWTQKADLGGPARSAAVGFSIGQMGYIGTGAGSTYLIDFWAYNPITNKWTKKANFGGTARTLAVGFSLGSKGYIGTGSGSSGELKDLWEYTPNNSMGTWKRMADFPGDPRYAAVGFSIGQKGYLGTGINYVNSTNYTWYQDFFEYDPNTNAKKGGTWTKKADVGGLARGFAVGFSINSTKGYIGTGNTSQHFTSDFWEYDPGTGENGTWTQKAPFPGTARDCAVGFSIGIKGYIGLGLIGSVNNDYILTQDFWEYSPDAWYRKSDFGIHNGLIKDVSDIGESNKVVNEELIVYPNPSTLAFNFRLKTTSEELVTIQIFDMMGRLVREYKSLSPDDVMTIGDNLDAGVFIAVVTQGTNRKTVKLNKVK